ncbi:hypothetical protein ES703_81125 [subsurface metagenome]
MSQQTSTGQLELTYDQLKKQRRPSSNCAQCRTKAYRTYWRPRPGMDQWMREYLCFIGHKTYVVRK